MRIRPVEPTDAAAILDLYAPYVRETAVTFEEEVPSVEESRRRIEQGSGTHPFLVAEVGHELVGYAKAGPFRSRAAYRWTAETAVYVDRDLQNRGVGHLLYSALLEELDQQGFATAIGVITLPNDASQALHRRCGFVRAGTLARTGYKLGAWHDTEWWQRSLRKGEEAPEPVRPPRG